MIKYLKYIINIFNKIQNSKLVISLIKNKKIANILAIIITITIVTIILTKVNIYEVFQSLKNVKPLYIVAAIVISMIYAMAIGGTKWYLILKLSKQSISLKEAMFIYLSAFSISVTLPFKSGDLIKPTYLMKKKGFSFKKVTSTIIFDNTLDMITVIFFSSLGLIIWLVDIPMKLTLWSLVMIMITILTFTILKKINIEWLYAF
jgi:uncharacterized protein (TIRG00374 family)